MTWAAAKRNARLAVHRQFAVSATYTAPGVGASPVQVEVRLHNRIARFGDLDREGYGQVVEDINRIHFLQCEVTPATRGVIEFEDGRKFRIEIVEPPTDNVIVSCDVVPLTPTKQSA